MTFERHSILDFGLPETVTLLNRGFTGYQVPLSFTLPSLLHTVRVDGIDATASQIVLRDGEAVGVALLARRGWCCRLAGMAIVPEARGQGVGHWLITELIRDAQARGEQQMVLEVIEENTPAVKLYQRCGFGVVRRLVSYQRVADTGASTGLHLATEQTSTNTSALEEIDIRAMAQLVIAHGLPDLPWQLSGESLAQLGPPGRAYQLQDAYVILSDPAAAQIGIRALVVRPDSRGQGEARRLLQAIMAAHPGKTWQVPALFPEEMGGVFVKAGFTLNALAQLQMARRLGTRHS